MVIPPSRLPPVSTGPGEADGGGASCQIVPVTEISMMSAGGGGYLKTVTEHEMLLAQLDGDDNEEEQTSKSGCGQGVSLEQVS